MVNIDITVVVLMVVNAILLDGHILISYKVNEL